MEGMTLRFGTLVAALALFATACGIHSPLTFSGPAGLDCSFTFNEETTLDSVPVETGGDRAAAWADFDGTAVGCDHAVVCLELVEAAFGELHQRESCTSVEHDLPGRRFSVGWFPNPGDPDAAVRSVNARIFVAHPNALGWPAWSFCFVHDPPAGSVWEGQFSGPLCPAPWPVD